VLHLLQDFTLQDMLRAAQSIWVRELAVQVATKGQFYTNADCVANASTLHGALFSIADHQDRRCFMACYLALLQRHVAGRANCKCVGGAARIVPCDHDWALARGEFTK
jgi:hypothetical protein